MVSSAMKSGLLMGFGSVGVVVGAVMLVYWPSIFFAQLRRMMILTETSTSFGIWREIPIPMYLECYMFNITNVEEILAGKAAKISVQEVGPYVYRETHTKVDIEWNDNSTVTFYNERYWYYEPEMSNGSLSDLITSVNPIVVTIGHFMRHNHPILNIPVDAFLKMFHEHMFVTANVSKWMFDGIDDPVLTVIKTRFPKLPIDIPYDKFGWFYDRNGSKEFDGRFLMNTGASEFSNLGNVEKWKYSNRTLYRDECGEVRGSTGELWAPELGQQEITIFAPDICTYMTLAKNSSVRIDGIDGVMYVANRSVFDNGYNYPKMACYCDEVRDRDCVPPGALNVSACRLGAPAFVSRPHFLYMDPHYPGKIDGLRPTEDMNFRLSLEMYTGMPLNVAAQLQINLLVRHVPAMTLNNRLPDGDTLVPMFWFRQEVRVTDRYARLARFALGLRSGMPYGFYVLTAIGVVLIMASIWILMKKLLRSPETSPILQNSSQENISDER
ncbi:protein croquemort-like [Leptidea sinapis]|uniref:protein croquemort-like n=1 Tax=Leptidea sinapis TaxID=189913 RepID=UPI00212BEFDC|nr:protein croquemort-like [Leptidea sinapis]XP_050668714.1 protein croquemort-like [Leptidea sinapis]